MASDYTGKATKPQIGRPGDVGKQLSDQLRTVFISTLIALWVIVQNIDKSITVTRGPWLPWVIASVVIFSYTVWRRKNIRWPKLRWVIPFLAVAILWLMYFIGGLALQGFMFILVIIFTSILLLWTFHLIVSLISIMAGVSLQGKFGRYTRQFAEWGDAASWPLILFVLVASIVFGITRLESVGIKDWQMIALTCLGLFIFLLVGAVHIFPTRRTGSK